MLDYDYIKNHYRFIAADLSRQKELDADPKVIQQIQFSGQLKKLDTNDNDQSMFVLRILENQRNEIIIFSRKYNSIMNNGKLSRSKCSTNKYTMKQILQQKTIQQKY